MTAESSEVYRAGLALPPADREAVALSLLESLAVDQSQVNSAWSVEIKHRVTEIRNGTARMLNGEEVDAMIEAALAENSR